MSYISDKEQIDKILEEAETYIDSNKNIGKAGVCYMTRSENIYEIIQPSYALSIGAFGDWSIYDKEHNLENFFHYIINPSFSQKRQMKRIWKKANNIYMNGKNKRDEEFLKEII
jgi:hypothetical protein